MGKIRVRFFCEVTADDGSGETRERTLELPPSDEVRIAFNDLHVGGEKVATFEEDCFWHVQGRKFVDIYFIPVEEVTK